MWHKDQLVHRHIDIAKDIYWTLCDYAYRHYPCIGNCRSLVYLQNGEQPMLSKVALVDSMEDSVGSKLYASRDRDVRDMHVIDESRDDDDDERDGSFRQDGVDEPDAIMFTPSVDMRQYDDTEVTETHGVTMKTQTGNACNSLW